MIKIFRYLKKVEWGYVAVGLCFIVGQVWLDLKMPDYMSEVTRLVQTPGSEMNEILTAGAYMLLCALGSLLFAFIVGYFVAKVAAGLAMRLREQGYNKTLSFSTAEFRQFSTASLITRTTNDITQIQTFVAMGLQALIKAPITAVWAVTKIAGKSWQWTVVTGGAVVVLLILLGGIIALVVPKFSVVQKLTDNLNRITRENLTGIRVVRAYNAERYQAQKFEAANRELTDVNLFTNRLLAIQRPGMQVIQSGLTLAIYWVGAYMIQAASMQQKLGLFSDMVVFSSYAMQIVMAFMLLTMTFIIWPRASVSAKRINEVLDTPLSQCEGANEDGELFEQGNVEFRNVSFRYPGAAEYVLRDISFTVKKGETAAFIGSTGSGKSTLINLIPRFYDATEGEVLVDGIDVTQYRRSALYNKLGYVPQRAVLFSGTVMSNVTYGDNGKLPADKDMVEAALEIAQADFVSALPQKTDSRVARGGTNLSGGQRQRLAIARAICRKPEIYIFDDSFSALDYKTDRALRSSLKQKTQGITTLIVAQRIGTIMDADKIIVLDEGRIAGIGSHHELMKNCPVYQEIANSQLSKEELEHA